MLEMHLVCCFVLIVADVEKDQGRMGRTSETRKRGRRRT